MRRIAVDVGGTFTDVVARDASGDLRIGKGSSTHDRIFTGIREGLQTIADDAQETVESLLQNTDLFVYSTTRATNAILEGTTAKTAFLVTEGHPDVLVLREGGRFDAFDSTIPFPEPYIPRRMTFEIRERIDSEGGVNVALDEPQARSVLRSLRERGVEAVAVCFLWSIVNGSHEQAIGRLIEEILPGVPYTLSHELNPIVREYRRASSTAIDASLKPLMQAHLAEFEGDLRDAGFGGELLGATSFGGVMHLQDLASRPINAVKSGPALAPVAVRSYARAEGKGDNIIACDTGGTSFDVSLVRDGNIMFTRETWLGGRFVGHMTGQSSVAVESIGAGGGSVAWKDPGGLLRVGPQSSGAYPGPACYGRGGDQPTVTDAAVVLGYLDPSYFLGGRMTLDESASAGVVGRLAEQFGQPVEHIAHAILTIASEAMVQAIQEITVNEGIDPRDSLIVAGGGAAGLNIIPIARELGCREVLVPRTAGALSACGAHFSDIVAEFSVSKLAYTDDFPYDDVNEALQRVRGSIEAFASGLRAKGIDRFEEQYFVEARYPYQVWELEVPLSKGSFDGAEDLATLVQDFHGVHERVFAVKEPDADLECLNWKGRLTGVLSKSSPAVKERDGSPRAPEPAGRRSVYFDATGRTEAPIYHGQDLVPGMVIQGPAVIAEPTTTVVVYPDSRAEVLAGDNYLLSIGDRAEDLA
ncbi:MAG: hydantoinase/oxoprolinase family protein [Conexibacter sp.]|nr:hydantoinase/oxoprolinase family protein [Conexibacter sp.]